MIQDKDILRPMLLLSVVVGLIVMPISGYPKTNENIDKDGEGQKRNVTSIKDDRKTFCLSNKHGIRLIADGGLIETPVPEMDKQSGAVCELEDEVDSRFKITIFSHNKFSKNIDERSLDSFSDEVLKTIGKTLSPDTQIQDKKQVLLSSLGYQVLLYSPLKKYYLVYYATVRNGFEYKVIFTFPADRKAISISRAANILEGLMFSYPAVLVEKINNSGFSFLDINSVKIPYPQDWQVFSRENISELKKVEVVDNFYSKLLSGNDASYVFKSKYGNEQLFTMTIMLIPKKLDLEAMYPDMRRQTNSLFTKDYGAYYLDKSQGKIVVAGKAFYNFTFEATKPSNYFTLYQFWFVDKGSTYAVKFKVPSEHFSVLKEKMDDVIDNIIF